MCVYCEVLLPWPRDSLYHGLECSLIAFLYLALNSTYLYLNLHILFMLPVSLCSVVWLMNAGIPDYILKPFHRITGLHFRIRKLDNNCDLICKNPEQSRKN